MALNMCTCIQVKTCMALNMCTCIQVLNHQGGEKKGVAENYIKRLKNRTWKLRTWKLPPHVGT